MGIITAMLWFTVGMMIGRVFEKWGIFDILQKQLDKRKDEKRKGNGIPDVQRKGEVKPKPKPGDDNSNTDLDYSYLFDITDAANPKLIPNQN